MKKREYRIGPGAASLILVIVVLAMSIFALLSLWEADNSQALSKRAMTFAQEEYSLSSLAQRKLMELDAVIGKAEAENKEIRLALVKENLPEGFTMEENRVSAVISTGGVKELYIEAKILPADHAQSFQVTAHIFRAP